jgi:hypothetical protein
MVCGAYVGVLVYVPDELVFLFCRDPVPVCCWCTVYHKVHVCFVNTMVLGLVLSLLNYMFV